MTDRQEETTGAARLTSHNNYMTEIVVVIDRGFGNGPQTAVVVYQQEDGTTVVRVQCDDEPDKQLQATLGGGVEKVDADSEEAL